MTSRARLAGAAFAVLLSASSRASAQPLTPDTAPPDKRLEVCIAAFEEGQLKQRRGNLTNAITRYAECASSACPPQIKDDCAEARAKAEEALPTVSFVVHDDEGRERPAKIAIDGKAYEPGGAGARPIDPGEHEVEYSLASGGETARKVVLVREGDKERVVVLPAPRRVSGAPAPAVQPTPAAPSPQQTRPLAGPVVVGGLGLLLIVAAGGAFLVSSNQASERDDRINELIRLDQEQVTTGRSFDRDAYITAIDDENGSAKSAQLVGLLLGGAGLLAVAGGITWYVLGASSKPRTAWSLVPRLSPVGAGGTIGLSF